MQRRRFLHRLGFALGTGLFGAATSTAAAATTRLPAREHLLQRSPLAGFQFYAGEQVWSQLGEGDPLRLRREAGNRFDQQAVAVYWRDQQLGYVARSDNTAISQLLDRGQHCHARIARLSQHHNPWARIELAIFLND